MGYWILTRRMRSRARDVARGLYNQSAKIDREMVIEQARKEFSNPLYAFLIDLIVQLIMELVKYWFEQGVGLPAIEYQDGEPGYK